MDQTISKWDKYKQATAYGLCLAVLLFALKFIELQYLIIKHSFEVYAGLIAVAFTGLGIWLALKLVKPKVIVVPGPSAAVVVRADQKALENLRISPRELEVLELIAKGLSNRQIADKLFVTESTIKTHAASLNLKLEAQRRTQAVEKAKQLGLIG